MRGDKETCSTQRHAAMAQARLGTGPTNTLKGTMAVTLRFPIAIAYRKVTETVTSALPLEQNLPHNALTFWAACSCRCASASTCVAAAPGPADHSPSPAVPAWNNSRTHGRLCLQKEDLVQSKDTPWCATTSRCPLSETMRTCMAQLRLQGTGQQDVWHAIVRETMIN
jgi:hypothetical protein